MPTTAGRVRRALAAGLLALLASSCGREPVAERSPAESPPPNVVPPQVETWKSAALKVEEDRQEPMGRQAKVQVPAELRHYENRHRFLAIQVAESRKQDYPVPYDYAELIQAIQEGGMVEMKPLGEDYILYGVGRSATVEPFTHYHPKRDVDVPLLAGYDEFEDEHQRLEASIEPIAAQVKLWRGERLRVPKRDRRRRAILLSRIRSGEKEIAELRKKKDVLAWYYQDYDRRRLLVGRYRALTDLASDFDGKTYDLGDPEDRRRFKARLLSFIRPEARDVLLQIARAYKDRFGRPLPVTSLVRTEEYQQRLGRGNPNATQISSPPHTTGLAFDILYKFMTAAEQDELMAEIARLEDEGRVEALREIRNHIHVFAFADGQRPHESLIAQSLKQVDAELPPPRVAPRPAKRASARAKRTSRASPTSLKPARPKAPLAKRAAKPRPTPRAVRPRR